MRVRSSPAAKALLPRRWRRSPLPASRSSRVLRRWGERSKICCKAAAVTSASRPTCYTCTVARPPIFIRYKDLRMSPTDLAVQERNAAATGQRVVNDFSIQVATVNGSGSQTANLVLLRSILLMGVPVSGKNMFPSNIAGLPTWYTIRASKRGYVARKKEVDFLVAMNSETAKEDVLTLHPGAAVIYDEPLKLNALRSDVVFYPVPFDKLVAPVCPDAKLRRLVRNMIYDGVLAKLLGIDLSLMEKALGKQLGKKAKAVAMNQGGLQAGSDYAEANLPKHDP